MADYLAENTIKTAESYAAGRPWTRVIWDVTAVAWLLNDKNQFMYSRLVPVSLPTYDFFYSSNPDGPWMRYIYYIHRDALFSDLVNKLTQQ